jgi:hypothetical protein
MNKRIEELSLQCIRYKLIAEGARSDFDYKKFAELIVRECAQVYWSIDDGELHTKYVQALKKHFGVE